MAGALAITQETFLTLQERGHLVSAYAEDGYPDRARKELLGIVEDYREHIPPELRAAAVAKAGQFMRESRAALAAGHEQPGTLDRIIYDMLTITDEIVGHVEEKLKPEPAPKSEVAAPPTAEFQATDNVVTLLPPQRKPAPPLPAPPRAPRIFGPDVPVVVQANDVSKRFNSTEFTLAPLSFELKLGQITALLGRNGSGKSTLLSMIRGELASDGGSIKYPMFEEQGYGREVKAHIGYVAQRPPRWRGCVRETLEFTAAAYGIRGKANTERVDWLLTRFGLIGREDHTWAQLSGGYQLRFELARALLHRPQLLILDEPLANLDIISQQELLEDLREIADSRLRAAILVTSQHLFEMEVIADQLILLQEGQMKFLGDRPLIGEQRQSNSFEVAIEATEQYLRDALSQCRICSVRRFATHYQLDFPIDVERADIFAALSSLPGPPLYIRDISNSSRAMMNDSTWKE